MHGEYTEGIHYGSDMVFIMFDINMTILGDIFLN